MKKLLLTLAFVFLLVPHVLLGQTEQENLWYNPGFEKLGSYYDEPIFHRWSLRGRYIDKFNFEESNTHSGKYCLKLFPSERVFLSIFGENEVDLNRFPIKAGEKMTLSYWHRGTLDKPALEVTIRVYSNPQAGPILTKKISGSAVRTQTEWVEQVIPIVVLQEELPEGKRGETISSFEVLLEVPFVFNSPKVIYVDDFSLIRGERMLKVELEAPRSLDHTAYEREIELAWDKVIDTEVSWEVEAAGKTYQTKDNQFIVQDLEPAKDYTIKVRALKGEQRSADKEIQVRTSAVSKAVDDITRLPRLRTLSKQGITKRELHLFYQDLHKGPQTQFSYWINGQKVEPQGHTLTFPQKGGHQELKIEIRETSDRVWALTYDLEVIE